MRDHVPPGSDILVAARGEDQLLDLEGYRTEPFPQAEDGSGEFDVDEAQATDMLERLRRQGARWLVVPKPSLSWLEWAQPSLQEELERRFQPVFADGSVGAIYSLE